MLINLFKKIPLHIRLTIVSAIARFFYVIASIYTLRLISGLININDYAFFAILINITAWWLLADLGIGSSLQNFIVEKKNSKIEIYEYILSSIILLLFAGISWLLILIILNDSIAYMLLKNFQFQDYEKYKNIFFNTSVIGILIGIGSVSHKICNAFFKTYMPSLFSLIGSSIALIVFFVLQKFYVLDLKLVSYIFFGSTIFVTILPLIFFMLKSLKILAHNKSLFFKKKIFTQILLRSLKFWIFHVTASLVLQIDYFVLTQTVNTNEITMYNTIFRLFGTVFIVYSLLLNTLWPSFTKWVQNKEKKKIIQHAFLYIKIGIVFTILFSIFLLQYTDLAISVVSKYSFIVPQLIILLFGIYFIIRIWSDTFATILLSSNELKPLWIFTPLQALLSLPLQLYLANLYGLKGILLALIISFVVTVVWALPYYVNKYL